MSRRVRKHGMKTSKRRGAAAVEFAFVAPLLILLLFALIQFSRATMVLHSLEDAANRGCRVAVSELGSKTKVEEAVATALGGTGIATYVVEISPSDYPNVGQWEPVTVTVAANYDDVSWVAVPSALRGITIEGSATLPREIGKLSGYSDWLGDIKR